MFIVKYKKIFFLASGILIALSVVFVFLFGLSFGIEFTGGSILEVKYTDQRPSVSEVEKIFDNASIREIGTDGFLIRTKFLSEQEREEITNELGKDASVEKFSSVGPTIGSELRSKAVVAIIVVVLAIIVFVAFAFRKVSKPVSSWKYGITAILALIHDIIIPTGVFAIFAKFTNASIDVLFVTALLAILGFSVNDTIVVFDRIRERLKQNSEINKNEDFEETIGKSLEETYGRSINTSLTTLIVLVALFIVGGSSIHNFALTLIVGVIAGTYSSIFLASPLLAVFNKRESK